ncbi:hypothetical protein QVD99_008508 [Batrachochytrium dendrobatidis]|nr:hypothetical protein O5D80_007377 [Batrachochytrium dendrobatidis]KAK5664973.1 hypothetical protein QVD99_008508 [Batrachochytrium dendrobatidis]
MFARASRIANATTRSTAFARPSLQMQQFRSNWNFSSALPNLKGINGQTTLGEVWDRAYVKYQYKLMYPVSAWILFLWYNLWNPYAPASEKAEKKARLDHLKSLEFHQTP